MPRERQIKTTFTAGEVSGDLLGRGDLRAYENGAAKLRNVFIEPTGGVTRRAGLRHVDIVPGDGRLVAFEFNTDQTYLLVFTHLRCDIYANGVKQAQIVTPYTDMQVKQIVWTQSADTLLIVHPDVPPKKLTRGAGGVWAIDNWEFYTKDNIVRQPYYKFARADITITPSATTGMINLVSSADAFLPEHAGMRFRLYNKEIIINTVSSPTTASASVIETLPFVTPTVDWQEPAFSTLRGYPVSVAFHQDRLVLGGSRELPNRLWFSCSGDLYNFNLGTGLDDEAIEFGILSDQVNAIRGLFSGRHLQVFTSGAEWMVTGDPLTPSNVQIKRQTRVGSITNRYVPPVDVDGATLFAARNNQEIRQFIFTDIENAYQAVDVSLLSRHIIDTPVDQDFDQKRRLLFLIRADGKFATLTMYRAEQVSAWTLHDTAGHALSVAIVGDVVYMLVERNGIYRIERIDDAVQTDAAYTGEVTLEVSHWEALDHLNGLDAVCVADGRVKGETRVNHGAVTLNAPAHILQIGLSFTHIIEPLPPAIISSGGSARSVRMIEAVFRVKDTAALRVDVGRGLQDVELKKLGRDPILDVRAETVTADIKLRAFGWHRDGTKPLWRIEQDMPLSFALLAVNIEIITND